jgi:hypothetical protein
LRPSDQSRAASLKTTIEGFHHGILPLPGIVANGHLDCLVEQMIDSLRRIEFVHYLRDHRGHDAQRMDPHSPIFDPLRASVIRYRRGETDEAFWLVFLATHFGKHAEDGWQLVRGVYGRLGGPGIWDWQQTSANQAAFGAWLTANDQRLRAGQVKRRFSNHRKYESLSGTSAAGTAAVVASYIVWVGPPRTHRDLITAAHKAVGQHPQETFDYLYKSMASVQRFGRLAKFDFLTMLGKLGFAPIDPGSAYLAESTGPLRGARLLFTGSPDAAVPGRQLDDKLAMLDGRLNVGMQVLEDALCNWQKSPGRFISFRG